LLQFSKNATMKTTLYFLLFILGAGVAVAQDGKEIDITEGSKIKLNGKQPLFVIDNEALDPKAKIDIGLEPEDIKEITVLRPQAATEQYGKKLGNQGIVMITTKVGNSYQEFTGGLLSESYTKPVYYVDGERLGQKAFEKVGINPDEIESIEVLKGFDKIPVYGEEALNGIILITTRS